MPGGTWVSTLPSPRVTWRKCVSTTENSMPGSVEESLRGIGRSELDINISSEYLEQPIIPKRRRSASHNRRDPVEAIDQLHLPVAVSRVPIVKFAIAAIQQLHRFDVARWEAQPDRPRWAGQVLGGGPEDDRQGRVGVHGGILWRDPVLGHVLHQQAHILGERVGADLAPLVGGTTTKALDQCLREVATRTVRIGLGVLLLVCRLAERGR